MRMRRGSGHEFIDVRQERLSAEYSSDYNRTSSNNAANFLLTQLTAASRLHPMV